MCLAGTESHCKLQPCGHVVCQLVDGALSHVGLCKAVRTFLLLVSTTHLLMALWRCTNCDPFYPVVV